MQQYRHQEAFGHPNEITVIEDKKMLIEYENGDLCPGFAFIDAYTVRAHPRIIDALMGESERLWTLEEILADLS